MNTSRHSGAALSHVIFDLDGTLVDSAPDLVKAVNKTLKDLGYSGVDLTQGKLWIGKGAEHLVACALAYVNAPAHMLNEQLMQQFRSHYKKCLGDESCLYSGVKEGLETLYKDGFRLSLCTNKPFQFVKPLLAHLTIDNVFTASAGGDTFSHKKPHPQPLLELCKRQNKTPQESIMIGDSRSDLDAARAAGTQVAMVDYGYAAGFDLNTQYSGWCFSDFSSLVDWLLECKPLQQSVS